MTWAIRLALVIATDESRRSQFDASSPIPVHWPTCVTGDGTNSVSGGTCRTILECGTVAAPQVNNESSTGGNNYIALRDNQLVALFDWLLKTSPDHSEMNVMVIVSAFLSEKDFFVMTRSEVHVECTNFAETASAFPNIVIKLL